MCAKHVLLSAFVAVSLALAAVAVAPATRADSPYLSPLSIGSVAAAAASPLCNLKECAGAKHCRASHVLSNCVVSSTGCVTQSCTR